MTTNDRLLAAMTPYELQQVHSSFSQRIPRATVEEKNRLRAELKAHPDAQLVADLREYFNYQRENDFPIYQADVRAALRLLRNV